MSVHGRVLQEFQVSRIERAWNRELNPNVRSKRCCCRGKPSLARAVFSISWHYVFLGNLCGAMYGLAVGIFRPLIIKSLVEELGSPSETCMHRVAVGYLVAICGHGKYCFSGKHSPHLRKVGIHAPKSQVLFTRQQSRNCTP